MKYIDRIAFITESEGGFNPNTGNHEDAIRAEHKMPCNISTLGIERSVKLFGEIDINVIVARLQRPYNEAFDYVEVSGKRMNVKRHVPHRKQSVFFLEGPAL